MSNWEAIKTSSKGFTLLELMIAISVIGILLSLGIPAYQNAITDAKNTHAIGDIKSIEKEILLYEIRNRSLPGSLEPLNLGSSTDPWGNDYRYNPFDTSGAGNSYIGSARKDRNMVPINTTFDLYSMGEDGESVSALTAAKSQDDIIRANDGGFVGVARNY